MFDYDRFAYELKKFRGNLGLSQEKMAEFLEINADLLSKIERRKSNPTTSLIVRFLNLLKLDVESFTKNDVIDRTERDFYKNHIISNIKKMDKNELELFIDLINIFMECRKQSDRNGF